jgi:NitT/TauT family transport system permease protein
MSILPAFPESSSAGATSALGQAAATARGSAALGQVAAGDHEPHVVAKASRTDRERKGRRLTAAWSGVASALTPSRVLPPAALRLLAATQGLLVLALWWQAPPAVVPRPHEVLQALARMWLEQGLGRELGTSLVLNLQALALAAAIGLPLAYLTVMPLFRPLTAAVTKGRFLGLAGFTFVFTLAFGGGHPLKLALLVLGMLVFLVTSLSDVVAAIPRERFDHARSLRMGEWRVVWEVVVLGTADQAFDALRQNAAIGWMMLTMVEGLARAEGGLGAMLLNQNRHFHLAEVFALQSLILLVGIAQDAALAGLKRTCCPYAALPLERS